MRRLVPLVFLIAAAHGQILELDQHFSPALEGEINGLNGVTDVAVQADGKIVIAGSFGAVNGQPRRGIARLNPDGSLDTNCTFGAGLDASAFAVVLDSEERIIVGGEFTTVDGQPSGGLVRFLPTGEIDTTFSVSGGPSVASPDFKPSVWALGQQRDGRILLSGIFTHVAGFPTMALARLWEGDGTLDTAFDPQANNIALGFAEDADGLFVGGAFRQLNRADRPSLARISHDGVLDGSFNPAAVVRDDLVWTLLLQEPGKLIAGGSFSAGGAIYRFNRDGGIDSEFQANIPSSGDQYVAAMLEAEEGKIVVGGFFASVNNVPKQSLARLNADGSLDETFEFSANDGVSRLKWAGTSDLLVTGYFTQVNGVKRTGVARLRKRPAAAELRISRTPGREVIVRFKGVPNQRYEVQSAPQIDRPWSRVVDVVGTGAESEIREVIGSQPRFYRVVSL
jgi:uncharacterized delta-60 repeat protein